MSLVDLKKRVAAPVSRLLKERGFRKSGLNFTATRDDATLIVTLQSSTSSSKDSLKITCNAGIQLHLLTDGSRPSVWDAHWRERIGFFAPERCDIWWTCTTNEAADRAGIEIAGLLESAVLPEMERLAVPAALANLWKAGPSPGLTNGQRIRYLSELCAAGVTTAE